MHSTLYLDSWNKVKECLDVFVSDWAFRGHRDASWSLVTSLERVTSRIPKQMAESIVYREFTRNAHNYLPLNYMPSDLLEWFALMQHHGAPTRLLDWTFSPYVACFFALEDALDEKGSCAVWAVDISWCKRQGVQCIRKALNQYPRYSSFKIGSNLWDSQDFKRIFHDEKIPLVLPAEPYRKNERLTIQRGLFLCPGYVNEGFENNFQAFDQTEIDKHLVKLVIPNRIRVEALTDLDYMNINRATLFPGIDGFSQSLKHAIFKLEDHGQINRMIAKRKNFGHPFS